MMENPEEKKAVTRLDLEAAFNCAPICWSWNSKAPKELNFSVDKKSNTPVHKKFPFAEAVRFVVPINVCSGYTYWGLAPLAAASSWMPSISRLLPSWGPIRNSAER
jgi:hypothetical protein